MQRLRTRSVELRQHRVHAARVVAEHAADGAAAVRGRIGAVRQTVGRRGLAQLVQHAPRLDACSPPRRVDVDNAGDVARRIEDQRHVAALAGEARASATHEYGRVGVARHRDRGHDVVHVARQHHAQRNRAIVGCIRGVQCAVAVGEADVRVAAQPASQLVLERLALFGRDVMLIRKPVARVNSELALQSR